MNIWRKVEQLEARIAELEKHMLPYVQITAVGDNFGETEEKIDACVKAFEEAFHKGVLARPAVIKEEDWPHYVLRGDGTVPQHELTGCTDPNCCWCSKSREDAAKQTTFTREHGNLQVAIDRSNYADGYVPDDFRG